MSVLAVDGHLDPDDHAVVDDESLHRGVGDRRRSRAGDRFDQPLHEEPAGSVGVGRVVTARHRGGQLVERPRILAPAEDQTRRVGWLTVVLGKVGVLEGDAVLDEPVEVPDAVLAVGTNLRRVDARTTGGGQECLHVLGGVLVPAGLLNGGAAAEVDDAARHRRGAPAHRCRLEHGHVDSGGSRLDGRAGTGAAEADDDHVRVEVPSVDVRGGDRGECGTTVVSGCHGPGFCQSAPVRSGLRLPSVALGDQRLTETIDHIESFDLNDHTGLPRLTSYPQPSNQRGISQWH